jgi:hypothetical protein
MLLLGIFKRDEQNSRGTDNIQNHGECFSGTYRPGGQPRAFPECIDGFPFSR